MTHKYSSIGLMKCMYLYFFFYESSVVPGRRRVQYGRYFLGLELEPVVCSLSRLRRRELNISYSLYYGVDDSSRMNLM
jgi:hypothetical protein